MNNFWQDYIPDQFIHKVENLDVVIENIFKRQEFILKHPELNIDPRMFVLLDDILKEAQVIRFSKNFQTLFTDGRHYKLFIIVTSQYAKGIPPIIRANTDAAIVFKQFQFNQRESICNDFLDIYPKKPHRYALLDNNTGGENDKDKRRALVIIPAKLSDKPRELLRRLDAEDPGPFRVGVTEFWLAAITNNLSRIRNSLKQSKLDKPKFGDPNRHKQQNSQLKKKSNNSKQFVAKRQQQRRK